MSFLWLWCVSPALAQEPAPVDSIPTVELEEVVITASRGGGDILKLPMAIGTVGPQELTSGRRMGLADALGSIPGVLVQSRAGASDVRMTIRGFGARGNGERSNAATVRGIKVLIDGIPETDPDGRTSLDLVDLSSVKRIEVIKTNASTLFGNASGGVVNIETFGRAQVPLVSTDNTFGSYGLRRNSLSVAAPLGNGSLSASLSNASYAGWRENAGSFSTQAHTGLMAQLSPSVKLRLMASAASNSFSIPGPLTFREFHDSPSMANPAYAARRERRANRLARFAAGLTASLTPSQSLDLLVYATPKELRRSERNTYREFYRLHAGFGAVYNIQPDAVFFKRITAGIDGAYQDGAILFYNLAGGERGTTLMTNKKEASVTLGTFLEGEVPLTPSLALVVGARFDRQMYSSGELPSTVSSGTPIERLVLSHVTPKVSLLQLLSEHHSVYATVSGGIEAPAFNEVDPPPTLPNVALNPLLKPMTSTTIEVGAKGFFFPEASNPITAVSYSVALYRISIRNEIVPYNGGAWYFSAGASERYGLEAGSQIDLRGGFSMSSSVTVLHSSYSEYMNDAGNYSGKKVPGIPPLAFSVRASYAAPFGIRFMVRGEHVNRYHVDDANTLLVPSSTLWSSSLSTAASWPPLVFRFSVGLNNLANRPHVASAYINPAAGPDPAYLEPGLPRNFFANIDAAISL